MENPIDSFQTTFILGSHSVIGFVIELHSTEGHPANKGLNLL